MKYLTTFMLSFMVSAIAFGSSPYYCHNITNTWTMPNSINCPGGGDPCGTGNSTWILTQAADGSLTGSINNFYCIGEEVYVNYTLTAGSSYLGDGSYAGLDGSKYQIVASHTGSSCVFNDVVMIPKGTVGCAAAVETAWTPVGTGAMTASSCLVPNGGTNGENTSVFAGRVGGSGAFHFTATLKIPSGLGLSSYSWSGRSVSHFNSAFNNTCSPVAISPIYGDLVWINDTNTDDDYLGWNDDFDGRANVYAIRNDDTLPCSNTYTEVIDMDCPAPTLVKEAAKYTTDKLTVNSYNDNTVTVVRNTTAVTGPFGLAPAQLWYYPPIIT
jgi:hypothetical protein